MVDFATNGAVTGVVPAGDTLSNEPPVRLEALEEAKGASGESAMVNYRSKEEDLSCNEE